MILVRHPNDYPAFSGKKAIGYWRPTPAYKDSDLMLPEPQDFVDTSWDPTTRELVVMYLNAQPALVGWRGESLCRLCSKPNGSSCLGDAKYVWPEGLSHYINVHNVRLPEEFVDHVRRETRVRF